MMTDELLPDAEALPAGMISRPQWLCWRTEQRDGKATKIPVDPSTGSYASTTDPETWTDFATAREYAAAQAVGIGFVFTEDDPLVGVDLDDCRDPQTGDLLEWADDIVSRLNSFTEVSPSGTGVHVLLRGDLPGGRNRHGDIELYETARFFTVTGNQLSASPEIAANRQDALTAVHAEYVASDDYEEPTDESPPNSQEPSHSISEAGNSLDDEELLARAMDASNGKKFERLWRGSTSGYESQSEADMAFCSLLAFWTAGDATQMDRLVRESGLIREKWDEVHFADGATYGERTIERAIAGTSEFYTEPTEWSMFDEDAAASPATEQNTQSESSKPIVDTTVISKLETEIRRLEDENERLREELTNERTRRQSLEQNQPETGPLHGVRRWLQSVFTSS